jgi:hypothetical protein
MSLEAVRHALIAPEAFTKAHAEAPAEAGPRWLTLVRTGDLTTIAALGATASLGVGAYGAALHAHAGLLPALSAAGAAVSAAGAAWCTTLPALYVLGALGGSRLPARSVILGALVTVSFGGLAMLASIPVLWFVELCLPFGWARLLTALVSFAGVGLCMADVFSRVMATLEGGHVRHLAWLALLSMVGAEMFFVLGLFNIT